MCAGTPGARGLRATGRRGSGAGLGAGSLEAPTTSRILSPQLRNGERLRPRLPSCPPYPAVNRKSPSMPRQRRPPAGCEPALGRGRSKAPPPRHRRGLRHPRPPAPPPPLPPQPALGSVPACACSPTAPCPALSRRVLALPPLFSLGPAEPKWPLLFCCFSSFFLTFTSLETHHYPDLQQASHLSFR